MMRTAEAAAGCAVVTDADVLHKQDGRAEENERRRDAGKKERRKDNK